MELYGVAIIIVLVALSFLAGMMTADRYNDRANREREYALERQYARIRAQVDYFDPAGPYVARTPVGVPINMGCQSQNSAFSRSQLSQFEERLKDTGSATVLLKNPTNKRKGEMKND